jgi:DNA-binding HxlR family transcriptional regulator
MRTPRVADPRVCSIEQAMSILGAKWAVLALRELSLGQYRFDEIVFNTGAPRDILATRLKELEGAGLVVRVPYSDKPVRYEYHPTAAAAALFTVLNSIREWGDQFARDDPENIVVVRHACGAPLHSVLICRDCGDEVDATNVHYTQELHRSDISAA